jgi:hypothetical protein
VEPLPGGIRLPVMTCLLVGVLAIGLRLALLPLIPIPIPIVHDEFSYLLGADTFASGRVTNPAHPMWVHFETFHVNPQPTYCSKYPPAQALFLAFGQKVLGHPWFGVCLSMGLMFACICWMLMGWVSPWPALLTTVLSVLAWGFTGDWINSYWGGAVAAAGGALLIGAVPRVAARPQAATVLPGAVGLALLANSRPFEGLLTAVAAGLVVLWRMRRLGRPAASLFTRRAAIPFLAVMIPVVAAMGYYNYRTTGHATLFPYTMNQRIYNAFPLLYWLPPGPPPVYRHENIRKYWVDWVFRASLEARAHPGAVFSRSVKFLWDFYFWTPVGLAMLAGLMFGRCWEVIEALAIAAAPILGLMWVETARPHYLAPALGAFLAIAAIGIQILGRSRIGNRPAGPIVAMVFLGLGAVDCARGVIEAASIARRPPIAIAARPQITERLEHEGGRHLVIVRYGPNHNIHEEWVYNRADIDASRIVWAQDMGTEANRELLDYYRGRKTWLLQPDNGPMAITPYPGG